MEDFPFQTVYDFFAKPITKNPLGPLPFAPLMIQLGMKGELPGAGIAFDPGMMLMFFLIPNGRQKLDELIQKMLQTEDETHCIVLAHSGHFKLVRDENADTEAMKRKGLMNDPTAQECIFLGVYHRSGYQIGCLPVDAERKVSYAPPLPVDHDLHHTDFGAGIEPGKRPTH